MMGVRTPEACWAVNNRQDNKLEKLLHLVGDLFELNTELFWFITANKVCLSVLQKLWASPLRTLSAELCIWKSGFQQLIIFWVRDLTAPMHLGLLTGSLCPISIKGAPRSPTLVLDGPQIKRVLFPQQDSRWVRCLISCYPPGPKGRNPDKYVWVRLKSHTDLKPEWPPGSQRYSDVLFISLKCPGKRIASRFPKRAPIRRSACRAFAYL
jgi:hypothetical protein